MNYRKMRRSIFVTILACLVMLSALPLEMAFAASGSGSIDDPILCDVAYNGQCTLSARPQGNITGTLTYAWGKFDKSQQTTDEGVSPITGAIESEYIVENYTNENIMYFCRIYRDGSLYGTVYYKFAIYYPTVPVDDTEDNPPESSNPPGAGAGQPGTVVNPTLTQSQITYPITIVKVPASVKAKAKKGKVTVSWKKIKKTKRTKALLGKIRSVQVQYSTDPEFSQDVHDKKVVKSKTKVVLKLRKNTVYYVRVRYVGSNGVSPWSARKKVKAK